jgi:hypothetical protein
LDCARHYRNARFNRGAASAGLRTHDLHRFGAGTDESQTCIRNRTREVSAFSQKPVSGMNRIRVNRFRRRDDGVDLQVTLTGRRRPDTDSFVSHAHVQAFDIRFRIDRHCS